MKLTRLVSAVTLVALAACSTSGSNAIPAAGTAPLHTGTGTAHTMDTPTGLPADTPTGLPADTPTGLPADTPTGLPADTPTGLPADTPTGLPAGTVPGLANGHFKCTPANYGATAACTIAVNNNVPVISDPNAAPQVLPGLHPSDITAAYNLPNGGGATVAIVTAFDAPNVESEMNVFRTAYGLGACTSGSGCFTKLNQSGARGSYPSSDQNWATEAALDTEMVSAVCPSCRIVLVEANSASMDDLGASVDTAAAQAPAAISNSYYVPEWSGQAAEEKHYNHAGIAVVVASGDQPYPAFPASSPFVTSVGGTSLSRNGSGFTEVPWSGAGHGCSKYVSAGKWQRAMGVPCGNKRSAVDVAAVADPNTGVSFFSLENGGWGVAGGTSVGTPIVAAAYALANNAPALGYAYSHTGGFKPLTTTNYDVVTGLGSPQGISGF